MFKVGKLVKLGCFLCLFILFIIDFIFFFVLSKVKILTVGIFYKMYYINIFGKYYSYSFIPFLDDSNIEFFLYFVSWFVLPLFNYIVFGLYINIFRGTTSKIYKLLGGFFGLLFGLLPGIFILLGSYQYEPNTYYSEWQ